MPFNQATFYEQKMLPAVAAYARFLLEQQLAAYTELYMQLFIIHGIDTAAYLPPTAERTTAALFYEAAKTHLTLLAEGNWYGQIETVLSQLLPYGTNTAAQLKAKTERLFLSGYIRKKAFKQFIPHYTNDLGEAMRIIEDIDHYSLVFERAVNETYLHNLSGLLELRETLYKEAQRMAHIGNWSLEVKQHTVKYSEEVSRICGFDNIGRQLKLDAVKVLLQPEDWQELKAKYFRLRNTGKALFYIATIRLQEGIERIVEIKAKATDEGAEASHIFGTIQDVTIEQRSIRSLQESERFYRHTETMANIGSWSIDLRTEETTFSEGLLRIYEIEARAGIVDMSGPRSYADTADRINIDRHAAACRDLGTRYELQYWITLPAGHRKLLHCIGEAINDANGQRYRLIGTVRDITSEYKMIGQLKRNELLYKQAQAIGRIGNWVQDAHTGKTEWSEELYRIFEVEPTVKGTRREAASMLLPADRAVLDAHLKRCIENGTPFDCKYRVKMPDERIKHFRSKGEVVRNEAGKVVQMIGTVQDITEQVQAEMRLREHQRFTQKITDIAPTMIAVYDVNTGEYAFISMAVEKVLGYKREEILKGGFAIFMENLHPEDKEELMAKQHAAIFKANAEGWEGVEEFKYRIKHKDGAYRWLNTIGTVFQRDDNGNVSQVLNISIDITGEKQAELVLSQKNMLLQQSNSSLEEFAYIASHDLQEPLRKISTFGNMLQTLQEESLSDSGKLYLRKIVDSSIRMQAMINDLLSVSVISGNRAFREEDLQELLEEVLVTLEYKIEQTGAKILQDQPLPIIKGIASQLRQLFQNLISNSLKFTRKDTTPAIQISALIMQGDEQELQVLDQEKKYIKIVFSDNGIGFSNTYAGKIFAIFQRLHGKAEYEGTGIGLAVCKKIAEHHNGIIYARGEVGAGASFSVILPVD